MTTHALRRERSVAELAVLRACILTKRVLSSVDEISKADQSPVTVADFAAQALIISALRAAFPNDSFVGEETADVLREDVALRERVYQLVQSVSVPGPDGDGQVLPGPASVEDMLDLIDLGGSGTGGPNGRFWVMDPVDGTRAFLRSEQYAVSIALIQDGREVLGVLGCPNLKLDAAGHVRESSCDTDGLGIMLSAARGQGTTMRTLGNSPVLPAPTPLARLSAPAKLEDLHIVDCVESKASRHDVVAQLAQRVGAKYPGTDVWSSLMRYAALVVGGGDVQIRVPARPRGEGAQPCVWDHAGAQLIFTELGGKVTDLDGRDIDFGAGRTVVRNYGMIIAKEGIHGEVLALVKELLQEEAAKQ